MNTAKEQHPVCSNKIISVQINLMFKLVIQQARMVEIQDTHC